MEKLKPCPFCGVVPPESAAAGKAVITHPHNACPLRGKMFFDTDWNRRAPAGEEGPKPGALDLWAAEKSLHILLGWASQAPLAEMLGREICDHVDRIKAVITAYRALRPPAHPGAGTQEAPIGYEPGNRCPACTGYSGPVSDNCTACDGTGITPKRATQGAAPASQAVEPPAPRPDTTSERKVT